MKKIKKLICCMPTNKLTGNQVFIIIVLSLLVTALVSILQKDSTVLADMWSMLW